MTIKVLIIKLIFLMMVVSLSSCIKQTVELTPESIKGKGLLVGHVSVSQNGRSKFFKDSVVIISGERYSAGMVNNFIRVPLAPGTYSMESLFTSYGNTTSTLPIKGTFTVKAGEVTNLGEVFLLFHASGKSRYSMIYLDNNDDMHAYLRSSYSDVYKVLKKRFNKANVKYIKNKYVDKVRRQAISQSYSYNNYFFTGPLGSIALSNRDKKGKIKSIKWLDTDTYLEINNCAINNKKVACIVPHLTKGDRIFYSKAKKYKFYKKPSYLKNGRFEYVNDGSILWINNDHSIYRSRDGAKTWKLNYKVDKSLSSSIEGLKVAAGKSGLYVYAKGKGSIILYNKYKTNKFVSIKAPDGVSRLRGVVETSKGLYTGLEWTLFSNGYFFYKKHGTNNWVKREIPKIECMSIKLRDYKEDEVHIRCAGSDNILSSKEGLVMTKIGRVKN